MLGLLRFSRLFFLILVFPFISLYFPGDVGIALPSRGGFASISKVCSRFLFADLSMHLRAGKFLGLIPGCKNLCGTKWVCVCRERGGCRMV